MSKKYLDTKEGSLEHSVLGVWKEAAKEQTSRQEALSAKQKKLDVDGDGEIEGSDLAKLRKKGAKKEGLENSPNAANSQHLCAKNVVHEEWGQGECVPTMHAIPDEDGNVAWYDVMFEHGIEKGVVISELKVTRSEMHNHKKKKNEEIEEDFDALLEDINEEELYEALEILDEEDFFEGLSHMNEEELNEYFETLSEEEINEIIRGIGRAIGTAATYGTAASKRKRAEKKLGKERKRADDLDATRKAKSKAKEIRRQNPGAIRKGARAVGTAAKAVGKFIMGKKKSAEKPAGTTPAATTPKKKKQPQPIAASYEWGTDEYRKHTQEVTPGQNIIDFQNFKVNSMKEALAKVWGFEENDKKKRQEGKTATGEKRDEIDLNPKIGEKKER